MDSASYHTKRRAQDSLQCSLPRRKKAYPRARSARRSARNHRHRDRACVQASSSKIGSYARVSFHRCLHRASQAARGRGRDRSLMPRGGRRLVMTRPSVRAARPPRGCRSGSTCGPRLSLLPLPCKPARKGTSPRHTAGRSARKFSLSKQRRSCFSICALLKRTGMRLPLQLPLSVCVDFEKLHLQRQAALGAGPCRSSGRGAVPGLRAIAAHSAREQVLRRQLHGHRRCAVARAVAAKHAAVALQVQVEPVVVRIVPCVRAGHHLSPRFWLM